MDFLNF